MKSPNYFTEHSALDNRIVLTDLGPWDRYPTLTNGIDEVIGQLSKIGMLRLDTRLLYYDSEKELTEVVRDPDTGAFVGFRAVRDAETEPRA